MVDAITRSMFGDVLHKNEPDINQYMLLFHYPKMFAPKLRMARQKISAALKIYINLPVESRIGECWSVTRILEGQVEAGMDDKNKIAMLMMIVWA